MTGAPNETLADFDRLLDRIPVAPPPVADIVVAGHAARRRRRHVLLAGTSALVVLAVGGTLGLQALPQPNQDVGVDEALPAGGAAGPDPGATSISGDIRLVGIGGAYVLVPRNWGSNDASCNTPIRDTVYFPYPQDCISAARPRVSSVAIATDAFPEAGIRLDGLQAAGELDGHRIVQNSATCELSDPGACAQTFGIPDLNAYFHVTVQPDDGGEDTLTRIRESLALLGADQTIVPFVPRGSVDDLRRAMTDAGLEVEVKQTTCPPSAGCVAGVTDISPAVGTVVPRGSTVTITVLDL